jgi:hypothetical protein
VDDELGIVGSYSSEGWCTFTGNTKTLRQIVSAITSYLGELQGYYTTQNQCRRSLVGQEHDGT